MKLYLPEEDQSLFKTVKQKAIDFIENSNQKSTKLISLSQHYSYEEVVDIYDKLRNDKELTEFINNCGYIVKLNFGHNRYAQGLPELTMSKIISKRGKSGWSDWT